MLGAEAGLARLVLDASVAVRWVVPEVGREAATALLRQPIGWLAPRLMLSETASARRRKVIGGQLRPEQAPEALAVLMGAVADGTIRLAAEEQFTAAALMLALTERTEAGLVTADGRLAALAEGRAVPTRLLPSA